MPYTLLGNVYVPEHFTKEIIEETAVKSALFRSGIIAPDPQLAGKARQGGRLVELPFWDDLSGNSTPLNSGTTLTPNAVSSNQDQCVISERGTMFGAEMLTAILGSDDPMRVIQTRIAEWWTRDLQDTLISILTGVFEAATMSGLVLDIAHSSGGAAGADEDNWLNANTAIDAGQLLGDSKGNLTAYVMHSAVEAALAKQDLIDYEQESGSSDRIRTFQGKEVIVDDRCPTETVDGDTVYHTYFFGRGAMAYEEDTTPRAPLGAIGTWAYEETRNAAADTSALITRKRFLFHPRGIKWTDTDADTSPTNAQFATGTNWQRKYAVKNLRLALIKHNVPQ